MANNNRFLAGKRREPVDGRRETCSQVQLGKSKRKIQILQHELRRGFIRREIEQQFRGFRIAGNRNAIVGRKVFQQRVGSADVILPQEVDRGAGFDEKENLRRFLDRGEAGERLLDPVIEYTEVLAAQPFNEVAAAIGDNHSDIDAVNADANCLIRLLLIFLSFGERTHAEHGRE